MLAAKLILKFHLWCVSTAQYGLTLLSSLLVPGTHHYFLEIVPPQCRQDSSLMTTTTTDAGFMQNVALVMILVRIL